MRTEEAPDRAAEQAQAADQPKQSPTRLTGRSWRGVFKRAIREFKQDGLTDWAAVLTYYGVLSIFPAMLAVVSILGLFGSRATGPLLDNVSTLAPGPAQDILTQSLQSLERSQRGAGFLAIISILLAIWSASAYIAAFTRAANAVYDMPEGRPFWKTIPLRVVVTVVLVILLAISAVIVVFSGGLADRAGQVLGIGDTGLTIWNIAKWPVLLLAVMLVLAILYWATPNVRQPGFRWITPGSAIAVLLWVIASAGFGFYVANFGSYNKTYGAIAGVIIFLIWLWITNLAVLFGVEVDAELLRARAIEAGHPADEEPYVEPRDTRKFPTDSG
ncbi:MAG TPA: YihY/virulence factor BrkB family protein [Natronosporangium sp.]